MDTRWEMAMKRACSLPVPRPCSTADVRPLHFVLIPRTTPVTTTPADALLLGLAEGRPITLPLKFGNRHGLIAGATGTGKTVSVLRLVEGFAKAGVPVVIADVKATSPASACPA